MPENGIPSVLTGALQFGIKPGLERITRLLELLGNPEERLETVHIAHGYQEETLVHSASRSRPEDGNLQHRKRKATTQHTYIQTVTARMLSGSGTT